MLLLGACGADGGGQAETVLVTEEVTVKEPADSDTPSEPSTSATTVPQYEVVSEEIPPIRDERGSIPAVTLSVQTQASSEEDFRKIAEAIRDDGSYAAQDLIGINFSNPENNTEETAYLVVARNERAIQALALSPEQFQDGGIAVNPKSEEPDSQTAGIGDVVNVGEVSWLVNDAQRTQELQSQFGEFGNNKQGNFVVVAFNFSNNSSEAVLVDSTSLTLIDDQGREFQADTDTFEYIPPEQLIFLEQVNPGVAKEGIVIFTVAPDASGFMLQVGDTALFSGEYAYINLGL